MRALLESLDFAAFDFEHIIRYGVGGGLDGGEGVEEGVWFVGGDGRLGEKEDSGGKAEG